MSGITMLLLLVVGVFLATATIKVVPAYLENFAVVSSLKSLKGEDNAGLTAEDVRASLLRRLQINDVANVRKEHISIQSDGMKKTVRVKYEVRKPLLGNVDLLLHFDESIVL